MEKEETKMVVIFGLLVLLSLLQVTRGCCWSRRKKRKLIEEREARGGYSRHEVAGWGSCWRIVVELSMEKTTARWL